MIKYSKEELKHQKFRLIRDGLTPDEADDRIKEMVRFTSETHQKVLKKRKDNRDKPINFGEEFKKLLGGEK